MSIVKRFTSPPRFIADAMLGSLARRMRLLGFDTLYDPDVDDDALLRESNRTGRILLTADRVLVSRPLARSAVLVPPSGLDEQISTLAAHLDLAPWVSPFARCAACNARLQEMHKDRAREGLPPFVWETNDMFYSCEGCARIYWSGSHQPGLEAEVQRLLRILKRKG
jgi:uncharacterized protein with PIN domain